MATKKLWSALVYPEMGQPFTNKILWSDLSYHELGGSALVNRRSLVSLLQVNRDKLSVIFFKKKLIRSQRTTFEIFKKKL